MYLVPLRQARVESIVKKSRFIATASHVTDRPSAMTCLKAVRSEFPDARHHCWAYVLGAPNAAISAAMSDDGEPSGTAGKPILNVLQHKAVGDVLVVVTRYFGGIKLGAGGLVRAYSSAAQQVMDALQTHAHIQQQRCYATVTFDQEQPLRHWLSVHHGQLIEASYATRVCCLIEVPVDVADALRARAAQVGWTIKDE